MEKQVEGLLRGGQFMSLLNQQGMDVREKYGLKKVDLEVLFYLYKNPDHNTAGDIQRFLNINKGYVSQIVDNLCRQEYLCAVTDQNDRRYVHYIVLHKTDEIIREIQRIWENISIHIFEGISEEEMQIFRQVAEKIEKNIMEMLIR